ncbi:hypothetical protein WG908_01385 [Sphingobium sp. AN641]|uniref:TPM domain-containing protein n=1 Tax=Sphingobium sp. AN641 TaxID=3133443 RepID=UPI0030BEF1A0
MAHIRSLSEADHALVTAAVSQAERQTDGEIVTIVAQNSDAYHDAGLHWAIGAVFLALSIVAVFPGHFRNAFAHLIGSWDHHIEDWTFLTLLLGLLIVKFLAVRYALAWRPLRMALTPRSTKRRRARRRAILLFRAMAQGRTRGRTAVLIYVSIDEHHAELVADSAINEKVAPVIWGEAMAALIDGVRAGEAGRGMADAVAKVGEVLALHFPRSADDSNELPDRLIEL